MSNRIVRHIQKMCGFQATITLMRRFGGRSLRVPELKNITDNSALVLTVGLSNAQALAKKYGGTVLVLPCEQNALMDLRNAEIVRRFLDEQESISGLANEFGLDRAMIGKIIDKLGHRETRINRSLEA